MANDAIFAWRQLEKKKIPTAAAILSLALAIGACTSAFRLIDALLLRPLPISDPQRLYALTRSTAYDGWPYSFFLQLRASVKGQAELVAASFANRADLTYASDQEMEKAHVQYVSGWMFNSFGLRPSLGRMLSETDDLEPGAHPVAVVSYDYWSRRFDRDPKAVGRKFRLGSNQGRASSNDFYEIVGVAPQGFTGTEPGAVIDVFLPITMNAWVNLPVANFLRTFVRPRPGIAPAQVRDRLLSTFKAIQDSDPRERNHALLMQPAAAGVSGLQKDYRLSLIALGVLVALVLLIACANIANLMTAQAAARSREMAIRSALGAARFRLARLVLIESAMLACAAAILGAIFAVWSAPFVIARISARLPLPVDWRIFAFAAALTFAVTLLFGLAPALRASSLKPASSRRVMHVLIAAQVAFCFLVLFIGSLFIATFNRLSNQTTGFSSDRLLTLDAVSKTAPPIAWEQVADHLRTVPGVEKVALAEWALLDGWGYKYDAVSLDGAPPPHDAVTAFLSVSPGWLDTMRIPLVDGRDFTASDIYLTGRSGVAIVNREFARQYFHGENPIGKWFETKAWGKLRFQIVGLSGDARYFNMRQPILPVAYTAFRWTPGADPGRVPGMAAFIVKTSGANPLALAPALRREIARARPDFYVSNIRSQQELVDQHTIRERLLAMLAVFFSAVALLLAGIGMYGVLDYSVFQRTREIGIRMAIGAQPSDIVRRVTADIFSMVAAGALAGLALGLASQRYIATLLYHVRPAAVLAIPSAAILAAALLAALPGIVRAIRVDPAVALRSE